MTADELVSYLNEHVDDVRQMQKVQTGQSIMVPYCQRCGRPDVSWIVERFKRQIVDEVDV